MDSFYCRNSEYQKSEFLERKCYNLCILKIGLWKIS